VLLPVLVPLAQVVPVKARKRAAASVSRAGAAPSSRVARRSCRTQSTLKAEEPSQVSALTSWVRLSAASYAHSGLAVRASTLYCPPPSR
jgi:hypothetical protein